VQQLFLGCLMLFDGGHRRRDSAFL
jgi:hypothetical protein